MILFFPMSLVSVSRQLCTHDHLQLRRNIPTSNRLGELSIKWLPLNGTGLRLIERHQYLRTIQKQAGGLASKDTVAVADSLNQTILSNPPHSERLTLPVRSVDFMGATKFPKIALILSPEQGLMEERDRIIAELDSQNGVNGWWGDEFRPHVPLATIPEVNMAPDILDAFWEFAPDVLTLERAVAVSS